MQQQYNILSQQIYLNFLYARNLLPATDFQKILFFPKYVMNCIEINLRHVFCSDWHVLKAF